VKEILGKIMQPEATATTRAAILRRLVPGRYELRDDLGRTLQAESDIAYAPGVAVLVLSGRIVARAGNSETIKTYEV
jgi:hypothetical protein